MNKINELKAKLAKLANEAADTETEMQTEYNKVFDDSALVKAIVSKIESGTSDGYQFDEAGEIEAYTRIKELSEFDDEAKPYLSEYIRDNTCARIDWNNDCALVSLGGDEIIIQDENGRDNGVWMNHKRIIDESEYKDDDGVNEAKRNELIEAYMERTGYFPGVFRVDYHGNIEPVSTLAKKDEK